MTRKWMGFLVVTAVLVVGGSACGGAAVGPAEAPTAEASATAEPEPTATAVPDEPDEQEPAEDPTEEPTEEPTEPPTATATAEPLPTATDEPDTPTPEPTADDSSAGEPAPAQGQVLLEERCTACHGLGRVESAQKAQEGWASTVDRMIDYGARLSDAERTAVIEYLAEMYGP